MSDVSARWDLSEVEVAGSARNAALNVVGRLTRQKDEVTAQWATAIRLARSTGATTREIARVAGVSPQTVANLSAG